MTHPTQPPNQYRPTVWEVLCATLFCMFAYPPIILCRLIKTAVDPPRFYGLDLRWVQYHAVLGRGIPAYPFALGCIFYTTIALYALGVL